MQADGREHDGELQPAGAEAGQQVAGRQGHEARERAVAAHHLQNIITQLHVVFCRSHSIEGLA